MAFNRENFAQIAGSELSPDTHEPLMFSYYADQDPISDVIVAGYFGFGPLSPLYDDKTSISNLVNRGALILVNSEVASGTPAFSALLVVTSQQHDNVETAPWAPWAP